MDNFNIFCNQLKNTNPKGFFITATDTNVGKSYCSAILIKKLNACYFKPIQSGDLDKGGDTFLVKKISKMSDEYFYEPIYNLKYPLSPHEAAGKQGIKIDMNNINLPDCSKPIIIEGAGGVLVPINDKYFMIDLIKKMNLPVILITRTELGTLNHSLLTIQALRLRKIPITAIVMNGKFMPNNIDSLKTYSKINNIYYNIW